MRSQDPEIQKLIFTQEQSAHLEAALQTMSDSQINWLGGYLTGLALKPGAVAPIGTVLSSQNNSENARVASNEPSFKALVLFGSQTGNAEKAATQLHQTLLTKGIEADIADMAKFKGKKLEQYQHVYVVVSTYGDGEPPEPAESFHHWIQSSKAKPLNGLQFAVFGLGDSTYEFFCQTAKDFDLHLQNLKATPIHPVTLSDVDFQTDLNSWIEQIVALSAEAASLANSNSSESNTSAIQVSQTNAVHSQISTAEVSELIRLTADESPKRVYHIEYEIDPDVIQYQPGDAVAIFHHNPASLVQETLNVFKSLAKSGSQLSLSSELSWKTQSFTLEQLLTSKVELTQVHPQFVEFLAEKIQDETLLKLAANKSELFAWLQDKQIPEIIAQYKEPLRNQAVEIHELINQLRPLKERLYSIASSQEAADDELHITVAHVIDENKAQFNQGSASTYITQAQESDQVDIEIRPNKHFKLPESKDTPVIMIGPGTGIAPFRSFLQQRESEDATGKNWLVFGNTHFQWDFLYQTEIQDWVNDGVISKLSLAFSRDQEQKVYVQDRLKQEASELYQWLQDGAHIYICGDKDRMAKDVESTLIEIIKQEAKLNTEQAQDYLRDLKSEGRYQKDVY